MIKIEFQEECGLCITKGLKWHLVFLCILEWCEVKMLFMKILSARMHIHSRQHNMKYFNATLVNDEFTDHILITNVVLYYNKENMVLTFLLLHSRIFYDGF